MISKYFIELIDTFSTLIPLNGKKPIESDWTYYCENQRLYDAKDFNGYNAGITCGPANGILAIDIDDAGLPATTCSGKSVFVVTLSMSRSQITHASASAAMYPRSVEG